MSSGIYYHSGDGSYYVYEGSKLLCFKTFDELQQYYVDNPVPTPPPVEYVADRSVCECCGHRSSDDEED
jgi:hypothetical protein